MKAESRLEAYRRLGYARGKNIKQQTINRILVPISWQTPDAYNPDHPLTLSDPKLTKSDGWRTITCPAEIKLMLKLRNQHHFSHSEYKGTPFTQDPLRTLFNWSASTHQAKLVLEGKYSNKEIDSVCHSLLDSLTQSDPLDNLEATLSLKQMRGKFKNWRETLSTSPSGRHLGHYKLLFTTIDRSLPEPEREAFTSLQMGIAMVYKNMINYAIKHNYYFARWKNIINMMILK